MCGGRDYGRAIVERRLIEAWVKTLDRDGTMLVHGGATGADDWAARFAEARGITTAGFPARWDEQGRAAGPIRNRRMLDVAEPHLVVAFPGGRGTANMVAQARARGVEVRQMG